jgi:fibronectin type 3 domain-containing protein
MRRAKSATGNQGAARKKFQSRNRRLWEATVEISELEPRLLYCADGSDSSGSLPIDGGKTNGSYSLPTKLSSIQIQGPFASSGTALGSPLSSIPALNSDPSAAATIYLDFTGASAQAWGSYNVPATPAFDQDGDATSFSAGELATIQQIWARVSEAYSPFNINVTTVDPGNLADKQSVKAVIGGSGAWLGAAAGGVSYVGSFSNSAPNVAWIFPNQLGGGNAKYTGDATVHELGHCFGLVHQSSYSGTGKTAEYRAGDGLVGPYMGLSYYSTRGKWSNGQSSTAYNVYQDDLAIISSSANGFGYRADDHGNTIGSADALDVSDANVSASGIITATSDIDVFSFVTSAGTVNFNVNVAQYGAMLDATVKLVDLDGNVIASSDTTSLSESITTTVGAGSYRLIVSSKGAYGDIGQYTISGTIVPSPNYIAPPSNLTAANGAGVVTLSWYDNAWNEMGYAIERSDDGGATWNLLDQVGANIHGYVDSTAVVGQSYLYHVYAFNDTDQSGNCSAASISVTPATPGSLTAASISSTRIDLSWNDVSGETGYILERSTNGTTWSQIATPAADSSSYSDTGVVAGTKYYYRLRATSSVGASANTATASATTRAAKPTLSVAVISTAQINLSWTNVLNETGYRIERSLDGSTWSVIATTAANIVSYQNLGLTAATGYSYRVVAIDAGGDSDAGTASTMTLLPAPTGLATVGVSISEIDLTWNNSTDETGYRVERSIDEKTWTLVTTVGADVTSYANTGLTGGTRYIYRVRANNAGGASAQSASASTYTVPLATTVKAVVASDTQINLTWTNVAGETNYILQRSDNGTDGWTTIVSPTVNVVAYNNTGLTADTSYYYRVVAHNASGNSTASIVVSGHTLLPAVAGLTATAVSTSEIDLAWTDSTSETGYRVERSLDERTWTLLTTLAADATTYNNTGLSGGTRYIYRVRANNAGGASAASLSASTYTIPLAPTLTATVASDTQINLFWTNVAGETSYFLQRSDNGTGGWSTIVSPAANVISYGNTALTADTSYYYRVIAHNASGDSAASAVKMAHTLLPPVTGLSATGVSTTQINLAWTDSTGESAYTIERSSNGITWALIGTTAADATTYSNTGLAGGTVYYYRVRAVNAGGNSLAGETKVGLTIPLAATLSVSTLSGSQLKLSWSNVAGESGYRIERSDDGVNNWSVINTAAANVIAYTDINLTNDTAYYYRVTPFNASGDAASSAVVSRRTLLPAPTGLTATALSTSRIDLAWDDSTGETGYLIERSLNGGSTWAALATVAADATSYSNTGLVAGTVYTYRLRAINAGGNSEAGLKAAATTIPPAVALSASSYSATQINLSWTNVSGETGYRVEISDDGSSWSTLGITGANITTYVSAGLTTDTLHYYRITAFNTAGNAASSTTSRRTLLNSPTGLAATPTSPTAIALHWNDTAGETAYKIERWTGKAWAALVSVSAGVTSYVNTGLVANKIYYYRIRATNAGGDSLPGDTVTVLTPAAAPIPKKSATVFQSKTAIKSVLA